MSRSVKKLQAATAFGMKNDADEEAIDLDNSAGGYKMKSLDPEKRQKVEEFRLDLRELVTLRYENSVLAKELTAVHNEYWPATAKRRN